MNRILLSIIAISLLSLTQFAKAQCVPDPAINTSGTFPAVLAEAKVGEAYEQVIQYYIVKDTTVTVPQLGTVNAKIDTLWITGVVGMPDGFTYTCHNKDCKITGGSGGCAKLSGTPKSGQAGIYPLAVLIQIRATAFLGPLPVAQTVNDTNARYAIIVNHASGTNELINTESLLVYPNPAKENVQFYLPEYRGEGSVSLYNMRGQLVQTKNLALNRTVESIDLQELPAGLYQLNLTTSKGSFTKKFIKE
jgi:hypothetical protein